MQKENNITTSRPRRFTVTGKYDNADQITHGDVCIVRPGASYAHGDLVLFECSRYCAEGQTTPHYHVQHFRLVNGKKYKFRLATYSDSCGHLYREGEEKIIIGPVVKVVRKGEKPQAKEAGKRYSVTAGFDWPYFNIHRGDVLVVEETKDIKPGQLVRYVEDGRSFMARCCFVKSETFLNSSDESFETYETPLSQLHGKVVEIQHDKCNHTKIEALRAKLTGLQNDDEHTLNITKAFEVEKEIYDLEHPAEEEEITDSDEWPEVIEDAK